MMHDPLRDAHVSMLRQRERAAMREIHTNGLGLKMVALAITLLALIALWRGLYIKENRTAPSPILELETRQYGEEGPSWDDMKDFELGSPEEGGS